jgi:hypothetical protein
MEVRARTRLRHGIFHRFRCYEQAKHSAKTAGETEMEYQIANEIIGIGDPSLYMQIFEVNKDSLSDPNLIRIGQKLRIP